MTTFSPLSGSSPFRNIAAVLESRVRAHPRKKAVFFEGRSLTYSALNCDADVLAGRLVREYGVCRGDKVAILLRNSPEFIISFFGIMKASAVAVPINYFLTPHEVRYIADNCDVKVIVTSEEFRGLMTRIFEKLPALQAVFYVDSDNRAQSEQHVMASPSGDGPEPGDVAVIIYTSGTTGHPKGAMLTHANIVSNIMSSAEALEISKKDRLLLVLPVFHSFTITACILMPIYVGACIVMLRGVRPFERVVRALFLSRITIFIGIPSIFNILAGLKFPWWARFFMRLRVCISGSAPLPHSTLKTWQSRFSFPLLEGYGLSEASPVVSLSPYRGRKKIGSVGLPVPGVQVRILGEPGLGGEAGEIAVKGPNVMKGYYNRPEDTNKAFHDGWLRTGDMGKIDEDGYIYIVGRKTEMILVHGMNVYAREIEEVLYSHPKVKEAAVVGLDDEKHGEIPIAFLSLVGGGRLSRREIKEHCSRQLARYKVPRKFIFMDSLPLTSTGKILKKDLREKARTM